MNILILSVSSKQPDWVNAAFQTYAKRLNREIKLQLKEIQSNLSRHLTANEIKQKEAELITAAIPKNHTVITLDQAGKAHSSESLADSINQMLRDGKDLCLVIGGAEGIDQSIFDLSQGSWSLSNMTLPHGLARVVIAEQIYRAWTILKCHPYHRS